ncbi:MAG: hypothetical protein INR69_19210, partial [Mucilaginibacter polytrichastri]|nr:hypothetical protein [Mucilaginibacter polytrichastri]
PIFSFQLTATEDVPLKFIYISSSYNALNDGKIKNNTAKLIRSDDNDFTTTGDNVDVTNQFDQVVVESNAIKFLDNATDGFPVPNGSSKYYFVVVDINNPFTGSGTPPPVTFGTSSSNTDFNATSGTFQFSANNKVNTNNYGCTKTQNFVALIDWIGANTNANNWNDNANWSPAVVPKQYDIARIGSNVTFNNHPKIQNNTAAKVKGIIFGSIKTATLTVDAGSSLTATDFDLYHMASPTAGDIRTDLMGGGSITVDNMRIGNDVAPPTSFTNISKSIIYTRVAALTVNNNVTLKSVGNTSSNGLNWAQLSIGSGTFTLNGQIETIKVNNYNTNYSDAFASMIGKFEFGNNTSDPAPTMILTNKEAILPITLGFGIDFSYPDDESVRQSTVIYRNNSTDVQTVYPSGDKIIGRIPANYRNIVLEGSGPKSSAGMNERLISGASNPNLITHFQDCNSSGGAIDLNTEGVTWEMRGTDQTYTADNMPVIFGSVIATKGGTKTLAAGKFAISASGIMSVTESSSTQNTQFASNGNLTLYSDANGSATVLPFPDGCAVTGNVNVQRFVSGSPTDLSKRGYRLISSAVSTATPPIGGVAVRTYDPNYLLSSAWVSGLAGGGFNTTGNPTLYLYREDLVPTGVSFTSSNYKGIAALSTATPFGVRTQTRLKTTYSSDTTVNIPIGTGMLFFFRGDKTNNVSQSGTKLTAPFDYPEDVVFTTTGTLNQGTVNVRSWYAQADQTKLSFTSTIANNIAPRNVRGYQLLGNPYPSSINWNKVNRNGTNSSIYGSALDGNTVWFFNPTNKQYASYLPSATADTVNAVNAGTNGASNIIASGQGFFIRAAAAGGTFRFMEAAKTTSQPTATSLNRLMGIPVSSVPGVQPYLRLQMKKDSINDDDILIRFDNAFSDDYNPSEDAEDMGG